MAGERLAIITLAALLVSHISIDLSENAYLFWHRDVRTDFQGGDGRAVVGLSMPLTR